MIAYNHSIKFIPGLPKKTTVEEHCLNVITVEQCSSFDLHKKILYELTFYTNQGRELTLYTDRDIARTVSGQLWAFDVKDVVTFFWYSGSATLGYIPHKKFTAELLEYWCLHIILPVFFTIEERYDFLHAGAVEVAETPILFVAESFGGKSTVTDFFMKEGHTLISDDKVATFEKEGTFFAVPSHPHHRPYRKMEELGGFVENFSTGTKPIHAIYKLERTEPDAKVEVVALNGIKKFKELRLASEINIFFQKVLRFEYLMKMAQVTPVFRIAVPWDIDRLSEVYQAVTMHSEKIMNK